VKVAPVAKEVRAAKAAPAAKGVPAVNLLARALALAALVAPAAGRLKVRRRGTAVASLLKSFSRLLLA